MGSDIGMLGYLIDRIVAICGWSIPVISLIVGVALYIKQRIDNK